MSKVLLLTGGAGFIGHHTVEHILKNTDWKIVILDRLSYAGNLNRLSDIDVWDQERGRVQIVFHDFRAPISPSIEGMIKQNGKIDYIVHMGAETHVDRSIENPYPFLLSNVVGTVNMLEFAKRVEPDIYIQVSTDEVYGPTASMLSIPHSEQARHNPGNPYAASKAAAEDFCNAYRNTYGMRICVTNTMNNFGERQDREKFVPKTINAILKGEPIIVHVRQDSNDGTIFDTSSRCWLHARNHADALLYILERNSAAQYKYNIAGERADVYSMVVYIAAAVCETGKISKSIEEILQTVQFSDYHSFRPGHDMHYGLSGDLLARFGWKPPVEFLPSLYKTVEWYIQHADKWLV